MIAQVLEEEVLVLSLPAAFEAVAATVALEFVLVVVNSLVEQLG